MTADIPFRLATVSADGHAPYVALVIGERALRIDRALAQLPDLARRTDGIAAGTLPGLLQTWDASFGLLCELAEAITRNGLDDPRWKSDASALASLRLHAPIPRPPGMFFASVNYPRPGSDKKDPAVVRRPYLFEKSARCAVGPYDDVIKPVGFDKIDWEVELALLIGRGGRRITGARAMDHVAGFLIANDITCREFRQPGELPIAGPDWFGSKCHEAFAPLGPFFVPRDFIKDCRNLRLTLKVNGELRQDGNSRDMIFSPEEMISHVSNQLTLEPGDLFSTGTPSFVPSSQKERYLRPGDVMEAAIEGLGAQRNRMVADPAEAG